MATLYVGTSDGDYSTIALAVKAAAAGDTIIVQGNEYTGKDERVTINKSLTLKAEGAVTMRGLNIGGADFDLVVDGINFVAAEADASGATGYTGNASCITQTGELRNVTIENCTFDLSKAGMTRTYGIFLSLGTWGFENLVVRNNECNGHYDDDSYSGYGLIYAANVNNADVSNNVVTYAASHAIQLSLSGKTYQGSGEQTVQINGNIVEKSYACAVYCADLQNSDMTVAIKDNIVKDVQEGSCSIYHGAIRIGACTISGVEITGNLVEGAQVGIYNGAAIKEGSNGEIEISGNALAVNQIHSAEEGVTPEFSGLGGTGIPEGTASENNVIEGTEFPASTDTSVIYVKENWSFLENGDNVLVGDKVLTIGTNAFADVNAAKEVAAATDSKLVIVAGSVSDAKQLWMNNVIADGYDKAVGAENGFDVQVDGTLKGHQLIISSGKMDVSATGKIATNGTDRNFRALDATVTVTGSRTDEIIADSEILNPAGDGWGGANCIYNENIQAVIGLLKIDAGSTVKFKDTFLLIDCGVMEVGQYWSMIGTERAASTLVIDNTQVMFANRGSYGTNTITVDNNSTVSFVNGASGKGVDGNKLNATVYAGSTLGVAGSTVTFDNITNNGTVTVSGASTVKIATVTGNGWIYMDAANLDKNTNLIGANVRFASGSNVVDGSTIKGGRFHVGNGVYQETDPRVDTQNGVTVTVQNDAHIGGIDGEVSPYGAWVGSEFYDKQEDKNAAMTDARYTLNINNSIAEFGYFHISHDGILNVTGDASELHNINATDYSFRSGRLNINGVATFSNVKAMAFCTNVSCDNATETPGKLVITNNAVFYAKHEDFGNAATFKVHKTGIVEVTEGATFIIGEKGAILNIASADSKMIIDNANLQAGSVTNSGTITVSGTSTLDIKTLTGNAIELADGAIVKDSTIGGDVALLGTAEFKGINSVGNLSVSGYNHKLIIGPKASLTANTGRTTLSYGSVIDVDGEIADAKKADKATLVKSLDIIGGFSFNGNGTYNGQAATLDVDNAYVSFGSSTSKPAGATGKFVFNFNNSIVDFTKDFQTNASDAGLTPEFQLNITDSVFNVGTRFAFNHANSVALVDNSVVAITAQFRNVGTFTLQNESQMTVGANSDGYAYGNTGNFGTLEVTSGSVFAMEKEDEEGNKEAVATKQYPFYNAGTVVVDNATFKANYITNTADGVISITGTSVVDGAITNNGTVKVTGETSVNLNVTGNAVQVLDGATITDSTIGGTVAFTGDTTLKGTNNMTWIWVSGGTLTVDGSLTTKLPYPGFFAIGDNTHVNAGEQNSYFKGFTGTEAGKLVVNGTYTAEEGVVSNDGELVVNGTMTASCIYFRGGSTIINEGGSLNGMTWGDIDAGATLTVNKGSFNKTPNIDGQGGGMTNAGTITVKDGIFSVAAGMSNAGVFNINCATVLPTITVGNMTNTGTINFTAGSTYKGGLLIDDADGAGSNYGTVNITVEGQSGFEAVVIDGDLYAVNKNAIYVNNAWATDTLVGTYLGDGMYFGINAFATLESIESFDTNLTAGPCTVYFDYAAATVAGLVVTINGEATITNYTFDDVSYNVLNGKQREHDIELVWNEENSQYEFSGSFNFSSGDFSFKEIETIVKNSNTSTVVTPDAGITEKVQVGGVSGDKSYTFSLDAISDFKYTISGIEGAGRLTLTNEAGEVVATRLFGSDGTYVLSELGQGDYKATFEGYGYRNDEAEFTVQFEFDKIEVEVLNDERANATAVAFSDTMQEISNAIGSGDGVDWFAITGMAPAADGTLVMDFAVEGEDKGSQILVNVYKVSGGKSQTIGGFVVNDTAAPGEYDLRKTFYGVSAGDTIYVQVFGYGESDYSINLAPTL